MIHATCKAGALALVLLLSFSQSYSQTRSFGRTYTFRSSHDQGRLGVGVQDVSKELKKDRHLTVDRGAYVLNVEEESPADKADIREGDVIVSFNGEKIEDGDDLIRNVRRAKPKSTVHVEVVRKEEHKTLTVTLGREPRSLSWSFTPGRPMMPRMPKMPMMPHGSAVMTFGGEELYGLGVEDLTKQLAEYFEVPGRKGVLVTEVEKETPAEKAGFKAGDIVVKANGNTVARSEDLRDELSGGRDREVSIAVVRKGKELTLTMKVEGEDDSDADDESDEDDDASLEQTVPRSSHEGMIGIGHGHTGLTGRTLDHLHYYLQRFKAELEDQLQEIRRDVELHFSHL